MRTVSVMSGAKCKRLAAIVVLSSLVIAEVMAQFARPALERQLGRLAADVVPHAVLRSPHYQPQDAVEVSGYAYVFRVGCEFGYFETQLLSILRVCLREIATLAQGLNSFQRTNSKLGARLLGTLSVCGNSFADILTSLFSTAGNLGQLANNVGDTLGATGARGSARSGSRRSERIATTDPIFKAHRRTLASQLELDVYSRNPRAQEFFDAAARARESARLGAAGTVIVRTSASHFRPIGGRRMDSQIEIVILRLSAREVDEAVMEELLGMGLERGAVQRFVSNPALSPRHRLTIAAYLDFLGKLPGRGLLVAAAVGACSEAEVMSLQELTRMYARYHESVAPLKAFRDIGGWPTAASVSHRVICLPVDSLHWQDSTERFGKALAKASTGTVPEPSVVMVVAQVTQAAERGLQHAGIDVDTAEA